MRRTTRFRQLLSDPAILQMPCCHDGLSARILEQAGFEAIAAAGYGLSGSLLGAPDIGLLSATEMLQAYGDWHRAGHVHSVETWIDGVLVGGLYFVAIGRMCFGESMFSHRTDASKIALAALVAGCRARGVALIDCQQNTAHLASLGAHERTRADFLAHVRQAVDEPLPRNWTYDEADWARLGL
jgi:hypothetical protein